MAGSSEERVAQLAASCASRSVIRPQIIALCREAFVLSFVASGVVEMDLNLVIARHGGHVPLI
jgi:hypothetical protein